MSLGVMELGAVDFVQKPYHEQDLLDNIYLALDKNCSSRAEELKQAFNFKPELTHREHEVLVFLMKGRENTNKLTTNGFLKSII